MNATAAITPGSPAHKELFCRDFLETHLPYDPATFAWPQLDDKTLAFLRSIPFWQEALITERRAGIMVKACADTLEDPLIREAMTLQAEEEARHGRLLECLIRHYDLPADLNPELHIPENSRAAFVDFGYGECIDSFLAFGFFDIAHQSGYFPEALFTLFDPVLYEEARHITFFINWITYERMQRGMGFAPMRGLATLAGYFRAARHLIGAIGNASNSGAGFTASGALVFAPDLTATSFLNTCLAQNHKRMAQLDARLLRPQLLPTLARLGLGVLNLWPKSRPAATPSVG